MSATYCAAFVYNVLYLYALAAFVYRTLYLLQSVFKIVSVVQCVL